MLINFCSSPASCLLDVSIIASSHHLAIIALSSLNIKWSRVAEAGGKSVFNWNRCHSRICIRWIFFCSSYAAESLINEIFRCETTIRKNTARAMYELSILSLSEIILAVVAKIARQSSRTSHHSTQIAAFQRRIFVFGSNDQSCQTRCCQMHFFFSPVVKGGMKQIILEPIFRNRKHEVYLFSAP